MSAGERIARVAIVVVAVFIALSAVAGGVGLIGGSLAFPLDWLAGTPFTSYVIPALILAFVVGGSCLATAILMLRKHPLAVLVALGAGLIQVGWIAGEVILVGTRDGLMMWLQITYFVAGAVVAPLAGSLLRSERRAGGRAAA